MTTNSPGIKVVKSYYNAISNLHYGSIAIYDDNSESVSVYKDGIEKIIGLFEVCQFVSIEPKATEAKYQLCFYIESFDDLTIEHIYACLKTYCKHYYVKYSVVKEFK